MANRLRNRCRFGATQYGRLRDLAIAAARANGASLWFAGSAADLTGFVWQDSAGTTPATGTDPIGRLTDRASSNNATQATAANKPTLELQANGYYGMRFDGVNDTLSTAVIQSAVGNWTSIASASVPDFAAVYPFYSTRGATANPIVGLIRSNLTGNLETVERNDATTLSILASAATVTANIPFVLGGTVSGLSSSIFVNGTLSNTGGALTGAVTLTNGNIGSNGTAGGFAKGLIFLVCASPTGMSSADRSAIERFAALLGGATYA